MMSVMVALTSASISSTGPAMGSCWQRCSALRICCRFCQMISASFSHLHGSPTVNRKDNGSQLPPGQRMGGSLSEPPPLTPEQSTAVLPAKITETHRSSDPDLCPASLSGTLHAWPCPLPNIGTPFPGR